MRFIVWRLDVIPPKKDESGYPPVHVLKVDGISRQDGCGDVLDDAVHVDKQIRETTVEI